MNIIILLIFVSLTIAIVFLVIFYWSIKSGQYDDIYTPSVRMLFDKKLQRGSSSDKDRSKVSVEQRPKAHEQRINDSTTDTDQKV